MRPLKLTFQAFGSYAQKATVDFDRLQQNLFLISGDTGSGKSTIFDALCYALYGEKSAEKCKGLAEEQIQSQYAPEGVEPFVELEFAVDGPNGVSVYTVRRSLPYMRPKQRGTGKTKAQPKDILVTPDGALEKVTEVNAKLIELVGLTKKQFMQIAMIAQGEFMQVLTMPSKERKVIFQKLFGTEIFSRIMERTAAVKKEREEALRHVEELTSHEAERFSVPEGYTCSEAFFRALEDLQEDKSNVVYLEEFLNKARELTDWTRTRKEQYTDEAEEKERVHIAAVQALTKAQNLNERFLEMDAVASQLQLLDAQVQQMREQDRLAQSIEAAYAIDAQYLFYASHLEKVQILQQEIAKAQEACPSLQEKKESLEAAAKEARDERIACIGAFEKLSERVMTGLQILDSHEDAKKQKQKAGEDLDRGNRRISQLQAELETAKTCLARLQNEITALGDAPDRWNVWQLRSKDLEGLHMQTGRVAKEQAAAEKRGAAVRKAQENVQKSAMECQKAQMAYADAEKDLKSAEAARLAQTLVPGMPCPVCGSPEHPHPHVEVYSESAKDLMSQSDSLKKVWEEKRIALEKAKSDAVQAQQAAEEATNRTKEEFLNLQRAYAAFTKESPDSLSLDTAAQVIDVLYAEHRSMKEKRAREAKHYADLVKEIDIHEKELQDHQKRLDTGAIYVAEKKAELKAAAARVEETKAQLIFTDRDQAHKEKEEAQLRRDRAALASELAEKKANEARDAFQRNEQEIKTKSEELASRNLELKESHLRYQAAMDERGLQEEEWRSYTHRYKAADAKAMKEKVDSFDREHSASRSRYLQACKAVEGEDRPDLAVLAEREKTAARDKAEADAKAAAMKEALNVNETSLKVMETNISERKAAAQAKKTAESLNNIVHGRGQGRIMDLETFAQREYLHVILASANKRLRPMSQYELKAVPMDTGASGGNKNLGLDLRVLSLATGKERDIRTLSGGESFMAALCLSLGMADQIERNSTTVHLDFMFLDEGFGSLDESACKEAIRVLEETMVEKRLVGIISHVEDLKQSIPDQLLVTKGPNGSQVRWNH